MYQTFYPEKKILLTFPSQYLFVGKHLREGSNEMYGALPRTKMRWVSWTITCLLHPGTNCRNVTASTEESAAHKTSIFVVTFGSEEFY